MSDDPIDIDTRARLAIEADLHAAIAIPDLGSAMRRLQWWDRVLQRCDSPIERAFLVELLGRGAGATGWCRMLGDDGGPIARHAASGVDLFQQYATLGRRLDFAILGPRTRVDVEIDGADFHSPEADAARDSLLQGAGWTVVRIPGSDIWRDPRGACDRIWTGVGKAAA